MNAPADAALPASSKDAPTVGNHLKAAREGMGLTVAEVADTLRFSVRQIEAIEADQYDRLPGATFVRGLVRGYAKFVRLDGERLVECLQSSVPAPVSDVRPPTTIADAAESAPVVALFSPRLIVAVLIFALSLGGALYAYTTFDSDEATDLSVTGQSAAPVEATPVAPVVVQDPVSITPAALPANGDSVPQAAAGSGVYTPSVVETVPLTPPVSLPGLVVEFDDRSWIEVRDASQSVVLSGEFSKGVKQEVNGSAPFQLWIGRASVVRVSYRGAAVDVRSRTREDVARLTVE